MHFPAIQGVIERRLLVNFRADPDVVARILPRPFEPVVVGGHAIVGICLIRLAGIRPGCFPARWGIRSENAAHRIAVRWNERGETKEGVFIPRRDSSSMFNAAAGGRVFPGVHHRASFRVVEEGDRYEIEMVSRDGGGSMVVRGRRTAAWPSRSVFADAGAASEFFRRGSLGYSASREAGACDGLEMACERWEVEPVAVEFVRSSFFEDRAVFPVGSVEFDCALVMRDVAHRWVGRGRMCCESAGHLATLGERLSSSA
jgi:hypothetical protein